MAARLVRNLGVYAAGLGFRAVADGDSLGGALNHGIGPDTIVVADASHGIGFSNLKLFHSDFPFCPLGCPVLFYGLIIYVTTYFVNRQRAQRLQRIFVYFVRCNVSILFV